MAAEYHRVFCRHLFLMKRVPTLITALLSLLLCSCVEWVKVSMNSYPDSVGKTMYVLEDKDLLLEIYNLNGVEYARTFCYEVPAPAELMSYCYAFKHREVYHVPTWEIPPYTPGMNRRELFIAREVVPADKVVLTPEHFEGLAPDRTLMGNPRVLCGHAELPVQRDASNYLMMPVTGTLMVADAGLSAVATVGTYIVYNVLFNGVRLLLAL